MAHKNLHRSSSLGASRALPAASCLPLAECYFLVAACCLPSATGRSYSMRLTPLLAAPWAMCKRPAENGCQAPLALS